MFTVRFDRPLTRGLITALLLLPVGARGHAQVGATGAGGAAVTLTAVQFFESGPESPPVGSRTFATQFEVARTRYIGVEVTAALATAGQPANFTVACDYRNAADSVLARLEIPFAPQPEWTSVQNARMWGWADPGNWKAGSYRVTCETGGQIGEGTFEVVSGPPDIPSIQGKLARMRFFESGDQLPPLAERTYAGSFASAQTRYIYIEVQLAHAPPGRQVTVPIGCLIIAPDGAIRGSLTYDFALQSDWTSSHHARGWGSVQPGSWAAGTYRVACTAEGQLIGQETFTVT